MLLMVVDIWVLKVIAEYNNLTSIMNILEGAFSAFFWIFFFVIAYFVIMYVYSVFKMSKEMVDQ